MKTKITVILTDDRDATCDGRAVYLPAGIALSGDLTLELSNGPLGVREYKHPHFLSSQFDFTVDGQDLRYSGFVSLWNLWAPTGTQVQTERPEFVDEVGQIDGMIDSNVDWSYIRPDGKVHTNRLKYTSCQLWAMMERSSLLVKCRYYDQNPDIANMVTIFYSRPLSALVFLKDTKVFYNSAGVPEDFELNGGTTITLKKR